MNVANLFVRASRRRADGPAVALGRDVLLTQGALMTRAAAIAGALQSRYGLAPGDRAALVMSNVPDYVELLLAGWHAGLAMVPANARLHRRELAHILGHAGARVCFVTPDLAGTVAPLADELPALSSRSAAATIWRCARASRSRQSRLAPTTSPGCSTPAARPAGPRAPC